MYFHLSKFQCRLLIGVSDLRICTSFKQHLYCRCLPSPCRPAQCIHYTQLPRIVSYIRIIWYSIDICSVIKQKSDQIRTSYPSGVRQR